MRNLLALIRILIIVGFAALLLEYIYGTEEASAIVSIVPIQAFLGFLTLILIAIEMIRYRSEDILDRLLHRLSKTTKRACRAKQLVGALCSQDA